eukprot:2808346-Amphidinium_carterae.2
MMMHGKGSCARACWTWVSSSGNTYLHKAQSCNKEEEKEEEEEAQSPNLYALCPQVIYHPS